MHHYLQRGHRLDDLINLDHPAKLFMKASMVLHDEEEANRGGDGHG
jgi:hypothetical protein